MIESLFVDQRPGWATSIEGEKERYEFSASDVWVQYTIDDTGGETVIEAIIIEPPF